MNSSIAIVSFSPINSDSRVLRQVNALCPSYSIVSIGFGPAPLNSKAHLCISSNHHWIEKLAGAFLLLFRQNQLFYNFWFKRRDIVSFIIRQNARAVILNDVTSWPLAASLPPSISILDAHEFSPQELADQPLWNIFLAPFKIWCSRFASLGCSHFCVEQNLCGIWEKFTGCSFKLLPNSSPYTPSHQRRSVPSGPLRVLHHGVAHPSRRIELMIEAIGMAGPAFCGSFLLIASNTAYLQNLKALAVTSHCDILPPIPQEDLINFGSDYDLAILAIYPSNLNYAYCLPNKLYQFIQSRLPIVCGPTPSIAKIVRDYQIGIVAEDFSAAALAEALKSLTPLRLEQMRCNLDFAARDLCWDRDQQLLVEAVDAVVNSGS